MASFVSDFVSIEKSKYYFEAVVHGVPESRGTGDAFFGFASKFFTGQATTKKGVGDDNLSYGIGFDFESSFRLFAKHNGQSKELSVSCPLPPRLVDEEEEKDADKAKEEQEDFVVIGPSLPSSESTTDKKDNSTSAKEARLQDKRKPVVFGCFIDLDEQVITFAVNGSHSLSFCNVFRHAIPLSFLFFFQVNL
jgi:hypothetical protein